MNGRFRDEMAPDGVVYPLIRKSVPRDAIDYLEDAAGRAPDLAFFRKSPAGVAVPTAAIHSDHLFGLTAMMLYVDDGDHPEAGTAFLRHHTSGISAMPRIPALIELVKRAATTPVSWWPYAKCRARPNRACFFGADLFHRAEPVGGYGVGPGARCVLTAFWK